MSVSYYSIYCNTENKDVYGYGSDEPLVCYNNNTHNVDTNKIAIHKTINENIISLNEEPISSDRSYNVYGLEINAIANTDTIIVKSFEYDVYLSSCCFNSNIEHQKDKIEVKIAEDEPYGILVNDVISGNNKITVNKEMMKLVNCGNQIKIDDGTNVNDLNYIISLNSNNEITFKNPLINNFLSGSIIKITKHMFQNCVIGSPGYMSAGDDTTRTSYLPAGKEIKVIYTNNSSINKHLVVYIKYKT